MGSVPERIIQIRKDAGLTQEEFAKKISATRNYVSLIENGKRKFSKRLLSDICRVFSVDEDWLLSGEGEPYTLPIDENTYCLTTVLLEKDNAFPDLVMRMVKVYSNLDEKRKKVVNEFIEEALKN